MVRPIEKELSAVKNVLYCESTVDATGGLITSIGLGAKNAILVVEYAKHLQSGAMGLYRATLTAARLRLRPFVMTSPAFILGVVPLMIAHGAGSEIRKAIGTGVFGGMVSATVLGVVFVPVLYVLVSRRWFSRGAGAA